MRLFAGTLFRRTPIWSAYLCLNSARVGRRVYVNSLGVGDHNLPKFGDDVVIGGDVHLSGHMVEGGFVKTAPVRLGHHVTVGLGSVIGIGVTIGPDVQIGALSLVPKHATLDGTASTSECGRGLSFRAARPPTREIRQHAAALETANANPWSSVRNPHRAHQTSCSTATCSFNEAAGVPASLSYAQRLFLDGDRHIFRPRRRPLLPVDDNRNTRTAARGTLGAVEFDCRPLVVEDRP